MISIAPNAPCTPHGIAAVAAPAVVFITLMMAQPCPALCDPMSCSPPGSSFHGILQVRILQWVAFPPPGDLPDPGIKPTSSVAPAPPALAGRFFTTEPPGSLTLMLGRLILAEMNQKLSCLPFLIEPQSCFIFKNALAVC